MDPDTFYAVKGILGVTSTVLLLVYMNQSWNEFDRDLHTGLIVGIGQKLRFMCLFGFAVLITSASYEQIIDSVEISSRNVGGLVMICFLIFTVIVSIVETYRIQQRRH